MKLTHLLGAAIAAPSVAQPGPGMGGDKGGRFALDQSNTMGWTLMSEEERAAHQQRMWSFTNYEECKAYQQQHDEMLARAQAQGKTLPAPRTNTCDCMQAREIFK